MMFFLVENIIGVFQKHFSEAENIFFVPETIFSIAKKMVGQAFSMKLPRRDASIGACFSGYAAPFSHYGAKARAAKLLSLGSTGKIKHPKSFHFNLPICPAAFKRRYKGRKKQSGLIPFRLSTAIPRDLTNEADRLVVGRDGPIFLPATADDGDWQNSSVQEKSGRAQ
jgi:hypothetical protein